MMYNLAIMFFYKLAESRRNSYFFPDRHDRVAVRLSAIPCSGGVLLCVIGRFQQLPRRFPQYRRDFP
jgi:hypothetical protein